MFIQVPLVNLLKCLTIISREDVSLVIVKVAADRIREVTAI